MRLIDADAIEYFPLDDVYNRDVMVAYKERIDSMPTAEAIPFKWKPFNKQKPPKTDDYLITYPINVGQERYVTIATWRSVLEEWEGFRTDAVIAWAEIPKPYIERKEE